MKYQLQLFALSFLAVWLFAACEKGACYYTCCDNSDNCQAECNTPAATAEECAIAAQESCEATKLPNVERVEWSAINDIVCQTCSSAACAPQWWTEKKYVDKFVDDKIDIDAAISDFKQDAGYDF